MLYIVETKSYDYFVGYKTFTSEFKTLVKAWEYYTQAKKHDLHYGDHETSTQKPKIVWVEEKKTQPKHGLVLGYAPIKEDILLPTPEEGVFDIFADVKDIIPSGVEEEYLFDTDDIEF